MKKILLILITLLIIFSGCSEKKEPQIQACGEYAHGESYKDDCNTCFCNNGQIECTEIACEKPQDEIDNENELKFNTNLTSYEKEWLEYYKNKYPSSKIYHIKTQIFNCNECYELFYKKDREILKIKILNGEIDSESKVTSNLEVYIENEKVCTLFQGTWNTCPRLCPTDEEICVTQCGEPACEFDENKIILKKEGEICGGLDKGDCEFGLSCSYESQDDKYGICVSK